ncbi:lipocalin family protein [Salinimicrobium sp. HB62]|uniref:lipocalin family protein n=1 Tax=Salinimicrobium sp. HB62 TaxID=3077781 RepID=UPI002D769782|nr:lipocalin family protein [Salinimicrobium sp. HB62]
MKKIVFLFSIIGLLSSCNNNDDLRSNTDLVGEWKLIEVLADPGDGSGTFSAVESNKIIRFHPDGTITSNGSICSMSIEANNPTSGTYSITNSTFNSPDCDNSDYDYQFEHKGNILIINYPCIEPCKVKYRKK